MENRAGISKVVTKYFWFIPVFLVIAVFYFWCVSWGTFSFDRDGGRYQSLAEGFMQGKLSMSVIPDPKLLQLSDPYDPLLNDGLRAHDLSLYHGKYYFYFGPIPLFLGYFPYKLLFGIFPDQRLITALFSTLSFFLFNLLFLLIVKPQTKSDVIYGCLLVLMAGFGNFVPFFLARSNMYEVAISVGSFTSALFIFLLYFAFQYKLKPHLCLSFLSAASLACGLGVGSRPNLIVLVIPLFIGYWILCEKKYRFSWGILAFIPLATCGIALAYYNYARFDSILEFGQKYQLAGVNQFQISSKAISFVEWGKHLITSIYMYMFNPPIFSSHFPFISFGVFIPYGFFARDSVEPTVGMLFGMPIVVLSIVNVLLQRRKKAGCNTKKESFLKALETQPDCFILFIATVAIFLILGLVSAIWTIGSTARYMIDFSGFLFLVTSIITYRIRPRKSLFALVLIYTLSFGFFTGMQGYYNTFGQSNPQLVKKFERFFSMK